MEVFLKIKIVSYLSLKNSCTCIVVIISIRTICYFLSFKADILAYRMIIIQYCRGNEKRLFPIENRLKFFLTVD